MIDRFILNKDLSYNELGQPTAKSILAAHREIQKLQNLRKKYSNTFACRVPGPMVMAYDTITIIEETLSVCLICMHIRTLV